jgi:sigma-B regulation protein RsbU (phosphoserine phosphatase)
MALSRAIQQTTLHQRTQQTADALVRELRPRSVAVPTELEVGYVYRSATRGASVGGDFFDWFLADSGHFGIACGDVSGKGVEAASLTAMAVYTLRAFALRGTTPQIVLSMLNNALCDQTSPERFATLAYARVEPDTGNALLGLAGHPPPVLVDGESARMPAIAADVPVGLLAEESFSQHALTLEAGQSLVLVTDGVTEARRADGDGNPELLGERGLIELLSGRGDSTAQELADAVWAGVVRWTNDVTADDCAIVVLKRR